MAKAQRKQNTVGVKHDQGKPRLGLISSIATTKKAEVMSIGAEKYGVDNWRKGIAWSRVIDALMRHINAYNSGETLDKETGKSHMAHAACCVDFLLEYEDTHPGFDDRYKQSVNDILDK
jgi:hypothetical protein